MSHPLSIQPDYPFSPSFVHPSRRPPPTAYLLSPIQIGLPSNTDLILDNRASLYNYSFVNYKTNIYFVLLIGTHWLWPGLKTRPPKSKPREIIPGPRFH
jgi:hypothetical protein